MPSGNGGVVQPVTATASITFGSAEGSANGRVMTQRPAGFLSGRKGSKCRRAKNGLVCRVRKGRLTCDFSGDKCNLLS